MTNNTPQSPVMQSGHSLEPHVFDELVDDLIAQMGGLRAEDEPVAEVLINRGHAYEFGPRALSRLRDDVEKL